MVFNFTKDYILEDTYVLLRPLEASDYEHLLYYSMYEPDIWQFTSEGPDSPERLKTYIDTAIQRRLEQKEYPFIIFHKKDNSYIGSTRFYDFQQEQQTIQLGYTWYGKKYQGSGINKNCKFLLFDFAFEQIYIERIGLATNNRNEKSLRAMKSLGCKVERILRNYGTLKDGSGIDAVLLSILKSEWQNGLSQQLKNKLLH
jgi:RimJ/RimL family protein N-acetyltransferase